MTVNATIDIFCLFVLYVDGFSDRSVFNKTKVRSLLSSSYIIIIIMTTSTSLHRTWRCWLVVSLCGFCGTMASSAATEAPLSSSSSSSSRVYAPPAPPNVIVVGGSSGMGKAAALETVRRGGRVLLVSRSVAKLERAQQELQSQVPEASVSIQSVDATDEPQVQAFAASLDDDCWDGLVVSAAGKAPHGPITTLPTSDTHSLLNSKLWSAYHCAKHIYPKLRKQQQQRPNDTNSNDNDSPEDSSSRTTSLSSGAAVVFVAGILNRRPGLNCAPLAMANGALEGLTRTLALEWGPDCRVNCLSPGFCETERFQHLDPVRRQRMMDNTAASLPLGRVGQPSDMGQAIYYLLTAPFCTGVILDVDGGHGIRQYANPTNDPMRQKQQQSTS